VALLALPLAGCWPLSLYPLYTDASKDTVAVPELVGHWKEVHDDGYWKITSVPNSGKRYELEWTDEKGKKSRYIAYVVDVKGKRFLDVVPMSWEGSDSMSKITAYHLVPMHTFWVLDIKDNHLTVRYMDLDWLAKYLAEKPLALRHDYYSLNLVDPKDDDNIPLLTTKPKKLQKFFYRHLSTPGAYVDSIEFDRS